MTYVPVSAPNALDDGETARAVTAGPQGHRHDETATTYVVGALTAGGGPSRLDEQAVGGGHLIAEPTPLLEPGGRESESSYDPRAGLGVGEPGDPMFTLQAGHQHGVAYEEDPARPVAVRGREGGAQAELGDEPVSNALRAGDGGSSRTPTILAYEVDKDRGVPNDEGVKVTETDVAPPLLADGDPAERTDRGLRVVQPATWRKARRAQTDKDDETWVEDDYANTLNTFDGGDTRATEVVVEALAFSEGGTGQTVDEVHPTLQAVQPGESSGRQQAVVAAHFSGNDFGVGNDESPTLRAGMDHQNTVPVIAHAAGAHTHTTDDGVAPTVTASKQGPGHVAFRTDQTDENMAVAYPIGQDALRGGEGVAKTPSADAEGRVRLRDPGLGVGDDGDPAQTITAAGPGAVAFAVHGERGADPRDDDLANALRVGSGGSGGHMEAVVQPQAITAKGNGEAWLSDDVPSLAGPGGQPGQGYQAIVGGSMSERVETGEVAPTLTSSSSPDRGGSEGPKVLDRQAFSHAGYGSSVNDEVAPTLQATGQEGNQIQGVTAAAAVRRLTPLECERLQGFPDEWTLVPGASDSQRYRELGNAVCAAVSGWLAWRITGWLGGWRPE